MSRPVNIMLAVVAGLTPLAALILMGRKAAATGAAVTTPLLAARNLHAFLIMLQVAEGTYGPYAYRMLYGGSLFTGFSHHPNQRITKGKWTSTAAGAYQILYGTWTEIAAALHLPDFSQASQDRAAVELIRRKDALTDVLAGRFTTAIHKCRKIWASLPGAGYGQHEQNMTYLATIYQRAGGAINT